MEEKFFLNPKHLPLVPPMDVNLGQARISPFPLQLNMFDGEGLIGAISSFPNTTSANTVINGLAGLVQTRRGIQLLGPAQSKVFASAQGRVAEVGNSHIILEHDAGFRYFTKYSNLSVIEKLIFDRDAVNDDKIRIDANGNPIISNTISGQGLVGQTFTDGEYLGKTDQTGFLDFELRYQKDGGSNFAASLPVDPVDVLADWESKVVSIAPSNSITGKRIANIEEITVGRQIRFMKITIYLTNVSVGRFKLRKKAITIYLPLHELNEGTNSLVETVKLSFSNRERIDIIWRESLFFAKAFGTNSNFDANARIKILHEINVHN